MPNTPFAPLALRSLGALALCAAMAAPALAQWQWIDNTGRKVFSDTAPPASIPDKNILKRPGSTAPMATAPTTAPATPAANGAPGAPAAPAAPAAPGVDKELEARKKEAEAAEEAKKKQEAERVARARADNCERAKRSKASLDSGQRMAVTNAKGEREIMDDTRRASETQRLQQIINSDCGSAPQ
ncbi:MAG TPA: DUF4124 domain-containing protein [Hydrogenophaga sp.]|uniref:DUF4124 domain-containing protein n=1 Tax=Hydrogenophaga sp. TaxID=1904254 RepID=UPI002BDAA10A|nr:DUF4124 domain-containing protein [Hydrogenophaga sp.]HSX93143.1 DUF4124 domain-containing protein [Hydrogenophaga sp.]